MIFCAQDFVNCCYCFEHNAHLNDIYKFYGGISSFRLFKVFFRKKEIFCNISHIPQVKHIKSTVKFFYCPEELSRVERQFLNSTFYSLL